MPYSGLFTYLELEGCHQQHGSSDHGNPSGNPTVLPSRECPTVVSLDRSMTGKAISVHHSVPGRSCWLLSQPLAALLTDCIIGGCRVMAGFVYQWWRIRRLLTLQVQLAITSRENHQFRGCTIYGQTHVHLCDSTPRLSQAPEHPKCFPAAANLTGSQGRKARVWRPCKSTRLTVKWIPHMITGKSQWDSWCQGVMNWMNIWSMESPWYAFSVHHIIPHDRREYNMVMWCWYGSLIFIPSFTP